MSGPESEAAVRRARRDAERRKLFEANFRAAADPANLFAGNREAVRAAIETGGESLARGLSFLLSDLQRGSPVFFREGRLRPGVDVATTPGSVVYQNELIELIQYAPTTRELARRPLLIVPPCINKYYVLDLRESNSFVRFAANQGNTIFMISWRNPGPVQGRLGWDDYLSLGVLEALIVAKSISRADAVNALGYCIGGTLLASALAVLAARGREAVASLTLLAAPLDFSDPGPLGAFVDEEAIRLCEARLGSGGLFPAAAFEQLFAMLRPADLIWRPAAERYLMGKAPPVLDFLDWNADATALPGPMVCTYLKKTYLGDQLRSPGSWTMLGNPVDLSKIRVPSFVLGTERDHIVPWRAAYRSAALLGGPREFVLGFSGHVAGVISPAGESRRGSFRIGPFEPKGPDAWTTRAELRAGSWWPYWAKWLSRHAGGTRRAPARPGGARFRPIRPAPGAYVLEPSNGLGPAGEGSAGPAG